MCPATPLWGASGSSSRQTGAAAAPPTEHRAWGPSSVRPTPPPASLGSQVPEGPAVPTQVEQRRRGRFQLALTVIHLLPLTFVGLRVTCHLLGDIMTFLATSP